MAYFLNLFPKTGYNLTKNDYSYNNYDLVTDITFRFGFIKNILSNISAYYITTISDEDRPEMLAEKVYGDPEAYWIILYANDMYDPQYDWPMNYDTFKNFIINKYGSIEWSQTNIHHYEKVITRTESLTGVVTVQRITVNYDKLTVNDMDVPYDYYTNLPADESVETINTNGQSVTEIISRNAVSYYDYENEINENKRIIKIIRPDYYSQIMREFDVLTGNSINPFLRTFKTNPPVQ
jgi:hypothetical protein